MAKLHPKEKAERARQRMIATAKKYQIGTYAGQVARVFQRMIRAEAGAKPAAHAPVLKDGGWMRASWREVGQCACVTCGKIGPWKSSKQLGVGSIETGHFIGSRRNSILFEEDNVAPQCVACNQHRGGEPQLYRKWMLWQRGEQVVERLERLKNETRQFSREELVDMKIAYTARLKAAEAKMARGETE